LDKYSKKKGNQFHRAAFDKLSAARRIPSASTEASEEKKAQGYRFRDRNRKIAFWSHIRVSIKKTMAQSHVTVAKIF